MIRAALAWLAMAIPSPSAAAQSATPLFAADAPLRLEIRGPIATIAEGSRTNLPARQAVLTLAAAGERHAIRLTPRGITRLRREICQFPPLRVDFVQPPPATSLFQGQRRLKLVTHCQPSERFQQHVLLEYAAYRLYNLLSPASFRVRLATIDYVNDNGRNHVTRVGFFIEDRDDIGRRIGLPRAAVGDTVSALRLEPRAAARVALFEYMIGNLDWSMRAGPAGEGCCHNSRLFAANAGASFVAVPYDFDYSGLVDAPYAVPPDGSHMSVRHRLYRGYCRHNRETLAAAAEFRALRPAMFAELATIPGLDDRSRRKAVAYLAAFFEDIARDERMAKKVLASCLK